MDKHRLPFTVAALATLALLVLAPLAAEAAGEVKGVTAPSSATKGTPVTITVTGKDDPCQNLDLDFGDGTPHATYTGPLTPPKTFTHTYTTTGTKTITAKGVNNCRGQATASIVVKSYLATLCATTNCGPTGMTFIPPKIDQVVPFISNITPGGSVAIKGSGFGDSEGELYLKGLKRYDGVELGPVKIPIAKEPGKDFWTPTTVLGFIPAGITQVRDQAAKLQIKTAANQWSIDFSVNFTATKQWRTIGHLNPAVKLISCGTDANKDWCNGWSDPDDGDFLFTWWCGQTYAGRHYNNWGAIGDDSGTDKFEITVKNGWVIDGGKIHVFVVQGEGSTVGPGAVPTGVTSWKPSVQWSVTPANNLCHGADVYIVGPKGVPSN